LTCSIFHLLAAKAVSIFATLETESSSSISLVNDVGELPRLVQFLSDYCAQHSLLDQFSMELNLVAEETFVNIVMHGYTDQLRHEIRFDLSFDGGSFAVTVEDDGIPFDPLAAPEFDPTTPLEQRGTGGLGIHLMRNLMDELQYERSGGLNRLTMRKNWLKS
jgi:anti-sigma regulatory factor (Ser/Thr protein kinase)